MTMPLLSITKQYSKAVFIDHTRILSTGVPLSYQPDVKKYAAGVLEAVVNGVSTPQPSGYYVETIDEALTAGTITLDEHAYILNLNPDMPHRPPIAALDVPTTT
jgi:hypothetical protein